MLLMTQHLPGPMSKWTILTMFVGQLVTMETKFSKSEEIRKISTLIEWQYQADKVSTNNLTIFFFKMSDLLNCMNFHCPIELQNQQLLGKRTGHALNGFEEITCPHGDLVIP